MANMVDKKYEIIKVLPIGKGQRFEIGINESEPEDSIDRYAIDTYSTGEDVLEVSPHWHKNHQEFFTVLEGELEMTLNGEKRLLKARDPSLCLPRRAVHSFKASKGMPVHFRERQDPPGIYKALFLNDFFSGGGFGGVWHALRVFYDGDAYLALPLGSQLVDQAFLTVFGGIAHLFVGKKPEKL